METLAWGIWIGLVAIAVAPGFRPVKDGDVALFEAEHGLAASTTARPFLRRYLTRGNRLRRATFLGAVALPPLATVAVTGETTGVEPISAPVVAALMVATLVTELTLSRPSPATTTRSASLRPRRLGTYLSPTWRLGPAIVGLVSSVAWLGALRLPDSSSIPPARRNDLPGLFFMNDPVSPSSMPSEVAAGVAVAILVPAATLVACRLIVRRPQPRVHDDLVAADDAVRTASMQRIAAMACVVGFLSLARAMAQYAYAVAGRSGGLAAAGMFVALLGASVSWSARTWGPVAVPRPRRFRHRSTTVEAAP
ncbi:MAG: hypothetical protein JXA83_01155 [Acidimicrobiales bacterium]|nr:hypothetical protein [Acidimicrobiales bacterium]